MFSSFSRRQVLKMIGAFVAGAATVSSISLIGKWLVGAAQAQVRGVSVVRTVHKGREIIIETGGSTTQRTDSSAEISNIKLSIDGKRIDLVRDQKSGKYATGYLPFEEFESPQKLAKEMIELGVPAAF